MAGGQRVHLLLDDEAGEQGDHGHRRRDVGARMRGVVDLPPGLAHHVEQAGVVQRHVGLEGSHALGHRGVLPALVATRNHDGVTAVFVHDHPAFLVRTPQAEGHEPGVQQARVIGILDVLHHQLPVARDALAVVAQQRERAALEDAVQPGRDLRAEIVLQRLDGFAEGGEHQAMQHRHPQASEAVVLQVEVRRHAAVDAVAILDAILERQSRQFAVELVGPLVIGAHEAARVAVRLLTEPHPAVGAPVLDHPDAGVHSAVPRRHAIANHDHLPLADPAELVVADVGDFHFEADIAPVLAVEDAFELALVQLRVGVGPEGHAAGARPGPAGKRLRCVHRGNIRGEARGCGVLPSVSLPPSTPGWP